jgi:hypothetical protein
MWSATLLNQCAVRYYARDDRKCLLPRSPKTWSFCQLQYLQGTRLHAMCCHITVQLPQVMTMRPLQRMPIFRAWRSAGEVRVWWVLHFLTRLRISSLHRNILKPKKSVWSLLPAVRVPGSSGSRYSERRPDVQSTGSNCRPWLLATVTPWIVRWILDQMQKWSWSTRLRNWATTLAGRLWTRPSFNGEAWIRVVKIFHLCG